MKQSIIDYVNSKLRKQRHEVCCDLSKKADLVDGKVPLDQLPLGFGAVTFWDNFTDLNTGFPQPVTVDTIAAVRNSQGTRWLPGSLGGTYYPKGYYISTGTDWEFFGEFSYQATQIDVDAGVISDQFVSPLTLANAAKWNTKNASLLFEDEGVALGSAGTVDEIDFTGAGVSATRSVNKVTVNIAGAVGSSGYTVNNINTSPYTETVTSGEVFNLVDASGGVIIHNLPTAVGNNSKITVTKTDSSSNTVDITPNGVETINGDSLIQILFQGTSIELMSDGANWFIT